MADVTWDFSNPDIVGHTRETWDPFLRVQRETYCQIQVRTAAWGLLNRPRMPGDRLQKTVDELHRAGILAYCGYMWPTPVPLNEPMSAWMFMFACDKQRTIHLSVQNYSGHADTKCGRELVPMSWFMSNASHADLDNARGLGLTGRALAAFMCRKHDQEALFCDQCVEDLT